MGSYRKDDYPNPDIFLHGLGSILERYSDAVITMVTDQATGIASVSTFPPSLAEVKAFCDEIERRQGAGARWDMNTRKQLEERAQFEREAEAESPEKRKAVIERVTAILAEHKMYIGDREKEARRQYTPAEEREAFERISKYNKVEASPQLTRLLEQQRQDTKPSDEDMVL